MWPTSISSTASAIASAVVTALLVGGIGFGLHTCSVNSLEADHKAATEKAAAQCTTDKDDLKATCRKDKQLTTEASNAFQSNIADLNRQLNTLKRVRQQTPGSAACVPVAGTSGRSDGTAIGAKYAQPNGVDANALYDFAGECEQYRLQTIGLQRFVSATWQAKGQ